MASALRTFLGDTQPATHHGEPRGFLKVVWCCGMYMQIFQRVSGESHHHWQLMTAVARCSIARRICPTFTFVQRLLRGSLFFMASRAKAMAAASWRARPESVIERTVDGRRFHTTSHRYRPFSTRTRPILFTSLPDVHPSCKSLLQKLLRSSRLRRRRTRAAGRSSLSTHASTAPATT